MQTATRESGPAPREPVVHGWFSALARLSLLGALLAMFPGCLIDDPPAYTQPKRTPPRLAYHKAAPLLDQLITMKKTDSLEFTIPVASEDAGEELRAQLILDGDLINYVSVPPSTLDDTSRVIRAPAGPSDFRHADPGCHRFTLRVAHASTLPSRSPPIDTSDVAEAYWWANFDLDEAEGNMLKNCPGPSRVESKDPQ